MKSAKQIFADVGAPLPPHGPAPSWKGFRAFTLPDITTIQREALEPDWAAGFQEALEPDRHPDQDRCDDAFKKAASKATP